VATATHGGQKLIAVVLGAPSANARTAKAAALLDHAFHNGSAQGHVSTLQSFGVGAAPDMRDSVCRNRGKANQEFLAEVEDMTIPLDTSGAQQVNVKDLPHVTPQAFEPVKVYAGRAAGYQGPVARARPPGTPVGAEPVMNAYAGEKTVPPAAENAPILHPAADARSLRAAAPRQHAPKKAASHEKKHAAAASKTAKPGTAQHHAAKAAKPVTHRAGAKAAEAVTGDQ